MTITGATASGKAILMYGAVLTGLVEPGEDLDVLAGLLLTADLAGVGLTLWRSRTATPET